MLNALFGPSLYPVIPAKINTDAAWLGLGSLYVTALASERFRNRIYSRAALNVCNISEEILSGVELLNDAQSLITEIKSVAKLRKSSNTEDFLVKRVQVYSRIFFISLGSFCNAVKTEFFLQRVRIISLSPAIQKQLERICVISVIFQQAFALFRNSYQAYLCSSLKKGVSQRIKKELDQKCKSSLMSITEIFAKIFIVTLEKTSKKRNIPILVLSTSVLALRISSYLFDRHLSHVGKWSFSANRFIYTC